MSLLSVTLVSSTQNVDDGYSVYLVDTNGSSVTLTMPEIGNDGAHYYFKSINTSILNTITIAAHSGDTINGSSSILLSNGSSIHVISYGTNWYLIE